MGMLQQAAAVATDNCQQALDVAHKLSLQLLAAEDQIKRLEAEVRHYQDRAGRAEQWLLRISREIESKFLETGVGRPQQIPGVLPLLCFALAADGPLPLGVARHAHRRSGVHVPGHAPAPHRPRTTKIRFVQAGDAYAPRRG